MSRIFAWKCIARWDCSIACASHAPAIRFRTAACEIADFFVDVPYEGEIVRAAHATVTGKLHEGGDTYITLPETPFHKKQIGPDP